MFYLLVSIFCSADVKVIVEDDKDNNSLYNVYIQIIKPENKSKDIKNGWTCKLISYGDSKCILQKDYDFYPKILEEIKSKSCSEYHVVTIDHVIERSELLSYDLYFFVFYNTNENIYYYTFINMKKTIKNGNMVFIAYEMKDYEIAEYKRDGILDLIKCLKEHQNFYSNTVYDISYKTSKTDNIIMIIFLVGFIILVIALIVYCYMNPDKIEYRFC